MNQGAGRDEGQRPGAAQADQREVPDEAGEEGEGPLHERRSLFDAGRIASSALLDPDALEGLRAKRNAQGPAGVTH